MRDKLSELKPVTQTTAAQIEKMILQSVKQMKKEGIVVSLSGGLDSAVVATLTARSISKEMVHLVNMPERDSNPIHQKHASMLAENLGISLTTIPISSILRAVGTYRILPLSMFPGRLARMTAVDLFRKKLLEMDDEEILIERLGADGGSWMARANAYGMTKHRIRMAVIYQYAEQRNYLVAGCLNRTEYLTGSFSHWGIDQCADIMPIMHLFRSQVEDLARMIKVPEFLWTKPADPDLYPSRLDKGKLLGDFRIADMILLNLENGVYKTALYREYSKRLVDRLAALYNASIHMRQSPYHLEKF